MVPRLRRGEQLDVHRRDLSGPASRRHGLPMRGARLRFKTPNAMTKLLKRLGFVYKLPRCVKAKARRRGAAAVYRTPLTPLMAAADSENPLYFVDATHSSYTVPPSHGWIRRSETRELKSNHGLPPTNNGAYAIAISSSISRTSSGS
jgi:hypothetical protein